MWTKYVFITESQSLLNRNIRGLAVALALLFFALIFSGVALSAFVVEQKLFGQRYTGSKQLLIIAALSVVIYLVVWLLKGFALYCRGKGKLIWLPLYLGSVAIVAFLPAWVAYQWAGGANHPTSSIGAAIALFGLIYWHFQFHADGAPMIARPAYHAGISLAALFW
ncbi:MAG TPA: hypothetical protein VGN00_17845 [Puia sp.]|jgi:hypothetical protein